LFGLSLSRPDRTLAAHTAAALACFVLGCVVGARIARTPQPGDAAWPSAVTRALAVEFACFGVFAVAWEVTRGEPDGELQLALLVVNAIALGIQSSAIQRFGVSGLSTTYLTGTLTTVAMRMSTGQRLSDVRGSVEILVGLIVGAAAGGALAAHAAWAAPVLQIACVGTVLLIAVLRFARKDQASTSTLSAEVCGETADPHDRMSSRRTLGERRRR
jgi:uncharacterized membrane protein YoaK (UPF0700 family)